MCPLRDGRLFLTIDRGNILDNDFIMYKRLWRKLFAYEKLGKMDKGLANIAMSYLVNVSDRNRIFISELFV